MSASTPDHELLSAYLDDELSPEDRARVEERLASDPDYAATLEAFRDQQMRLRSLPKGSIDVRQSVMAAIGEESISTVAAADVGSGEAQSAWRLNPWALASLAALLLLGVFLFLPNRQADQAVVQNEVSSADEMLADEVGDELGFAAEGATGGAMPKSDDSDATSFAPQEPEAAYKSDSQSALAAGATAAPQPKGQEFGMSLHVRQDQHLDMESLAGERVDRMPAAMQSQPGAARTRSLAAEADSFPVPAFSQPTRSSRVESRATSKKAAGVPLGDTANERAAIEAAVKEYDLVDDADSLKRLDKNRFRNWVVQPTSAKSGQRMAIDRLRKAFDEAGCAYRRLEPANPSSRLKKADRAEAATEKPAIEFIVTATPKQLVKLRERAGEFASMERGDITMRSFRSEMTPADWDGSKLPRDENLDPPGEGRTYLFYVHPEKELPAVKKEAESP